MISEDELKRHLDNFSEIMSMNSIHGNDKTYTKAAQWLGKYIKLVPPEFLISRKDHLDRERLYYPYSIYEIPSSLYGFEVLCKKPNGETVKLYSKIFDTFEVREFEYEEWIIEGIK